ncbi:MAG: NosD domain-containing protein [Candidatus Micrarchaeales archaeon]
MFGYNFPLNLSPESSQQPDLDQQVNQAQGQYGQDQDAIERLKKRQSGGNIRIVLGVLALIVLIVVGVVIIGIKPSTTGGGTTVTTIASLQSEIQGCMNITKPGSYYLSKDINVNLNRGACINVKSGNVQLVGNQNKLTGSGPFTGVPPFTYGIYVGGFSNVTVSGFALSSFSYDIYLNNTTNSKLVFNNVTKSAMSGIFLNSSSNNIVANNTVSSASSKSGALGLYKGGFNRIIGDAVLENAYYGMVINSTNNTFQKDIMTGNPEDLVCNSLNASFRQNNQFSSSTCAYNYGCNFAQCTSTNIPSNISAVTLGSKSINSCGSINGGGRYTLAQSLDMNNYLNTSNPLAKNYPCIRILSPNVNLNCNGNTISNAPYAINASSQFNTTISNCVLRNDTVGVFASFNFNIKISNLTVSNAQYGIKLTNGTLGAVLNTTVLNSTYGIYLNGTGSVILGNDNASKNAYGAYVDKTTSISFNTGKYQSNTKSDIYCSAGTYNGTQNQYQGISCGTSDCSWANSCAVKQKPPITLVPVNNCDTILQSGSYSLTGNLIGGNKCINIQTSNVDFSCNNYQISGSLSGTGIFIGSADDNVTVQKCNVNRFQTGISSSNSSLITLLNNRVINSGIGYSLKNLTDAALYGNNVTSATAYAAFVLNKLTSSNVTMNSASATAGSNSTDGFTITNSSNNIFSFNNATLNNGYGFVITNSANNRIFNNSASANTKLDYICTNSSIGIYSELGGINFGSTKGNCRWMVELNPTVQQQPCAAISLGAYIDYTGDALYKFGGTCFTVFNTPPTPVTNSTPRPATTANGTVINCGHHTILATNGGTFLNVINSSKVELENCYLKNFTNAVRTSGYGTLIQNNTIATTANVSIGVYSTSYPMINNNKVLNASYGVFVTNSLQGMISNNRIINANNSMAFVKGTGFNILNNTANKGASGIRFLNATIESVQQNLLLNQSLAGIMCVKYSQNSTSLNRDMGGNICSSNLNCLWMTSSGQCSPH